jgi:CMP/dCMP kinase
VNAARSEVIRLQLPPRTIITIDGPAGTGKSSVARELARRLGLDFLDTGAMYRAATAIAIDRGIGPDEQERLVAVVAEADLHFDWGTDPPAMLAWNEPVGERIRDADVNALVSEVSAIAPLREHMVKKQRLIGRQHPRLVTEGRDQGSVVFPDAAVKFYMDARPEVRAQRRADQLRESGRGANLGRLTEEIRRRDELDSTRPVGPLVCPADAERVDTSDMSFEEVVAHLERKVRAGLVWRG